MDATAFSRFAQVKEHPRRTVNATAGGVGGADQRQQTKVLNGAVRQRLVQPLVKAAARHIKHFAHRRDAMFLVVLIYERVLCSGSLAKYAAAFFKMSRSSSVRRSCARNLKISPLASTNSLAC